MIATIFFPVALDACFADQVEQAQRARKAGLQLYTNGRQLALLPRALAGWALVARG